MRYENFAPQLVKRGYDPTPCHGKKPYLDEWQKRPETALAYERHSDANIGVLTGGQHNLIAIDIDVPFEPAAGIIMEWIADNFPPMPERIGDHPKRLFSARSEQLRKKEKSAVYLKMDPETGEIACNKDGKEIRIAVEILGEGQQYIASGVHPDTGQKYVYPNDNLLDYPAAELPLIKDDQIDELINFVERTFERYFISAKTTESKQQATASDNLNFSDCPALETITDALMHIKADEYDEWIKIGLILHNDYGTDEAFSIWDKWSSSSSKYGIDGSRTCLEKWNSFKSPAAGTRRASVGTILYLAKQSGWQETNNKSSNTSEKKGLALMSVSELLRLPPPEYLIENILPDSGVAIMAGKSGDMKSFLAILFTMSVATGMDIGGLKVKPGKSLYMMNEGQAGFGMRCQAWLNRNNLPSPDTFKAITMTPNLMRSETVGPFIDAIKQENFDPDFIVLDTFSKAIIGGDDNQTQDVSKALDTAYGLANEFDALVLIIDHVGKDPKKGVRGSYAKYGNVDAIVMVTKQDTVITAITKKQKEGEDNLRFYFRQELVKATHPLSNETNFIPVLSPTTIDLTQKQFILVALDDRGPAPRKDVQEAFVERFGVSTKKSFNTVLERLKGAGKVIEQGNVLEAVDDE